MANFRQQKALYSHLEKVLEKGGSEEGFYVYFPLFCYTLPMPKEDITSKASLSAASPTSSFVHLHTHSHYSLLSALPKIEDLVAEAKKYHMPALALTDAGNMYGAIEFYKECKKAGIKPILGVDFYVAARGRGDMQAGVDNRRTRLVLLAKDLVGYRNLIKLVTASYLEGFYYKPRIDHELLEKYSAGLIAIAPSFSSEISQVVKNHDIAKARELIAFYTRVFNGEKKSAGENFYIEITRHPEIEGHEALMQELIKLARETDTPITAAHDIYYLHPDDKLARDTLMLVNTVHDAGERGATPGGGGNSGRGSGGTAGSSAMGGDAQDEEDFSFISPARAEELFKDLPEALENTAKIAAACNLDLKLGSWFFPNYIVGNGLSYDDELKRLANEGIATRGLTKTAEITDRLDYELGLIKKKGYAQYFLVVSDLLRFAHERNILTTIRGSVAGSLTTYLAGITNINPLEYNIPFERFLNPERPSAPDIDMDFADNRRDEVIEYTRQKYGVDKVAQIGTFGTMMAKGAVRDVARALGYPYEVGDRISKLIPLGMQGFPMTIDRAMAEVPELKAMYEDNENGRDGNDTRRIIDLAKKIEGCARHISVHAAGVVIAPEPLAEYVPIQYDAKGEKKIITQYDMYSVGEDGVGLLKFDFLGIKNLSILADAVERVKKIENITIDIENIPLDDKKTFEMLARGETIGLFQLNGSGITRFLVELKPSTIHDINAMVALYRPGPLESIPQYIERKHDPSKVKFLDPRLKDILNRSFGIITYQDDVLLTAIKLGGYSWLEADKLRKAMGKKIPKEMQGEKTKLIAGFIKNGLTEKKAAELWKLIEPFAAYGFGKAHAASYGRVAYQTAYMKANFPAIYMSAVLTADSGDVEKIAEIVAECKRMGIPILPPDVNESFSQFTVIKGEEKDGKKLPDRIRFGLVTIKNFGQGIATAIIEERKKTGSAGGRFKSLADFLDRVRDRNLNKKSLEALIKSGAMDNFGHDRGVLLGNIETLLAYNKEHEHTSENQDSLFRSMTDTSSIPTLKLADFPTAASTEKLAWEKELLGLYISGHPLDRYRAIIDKRDMTIAKVKVMQLPGGNSATNGIEKKENKNGTPAKKPEDPIVVIAAIVDEVRPVMTKKNEMMLFIKITDFTGTLEAVVFPRTYQEFRTAFVPEQCLALKGRITERRGEKSMIVERVKKLG
jgi:DNA polymerase-3 subunit alpha